MEYHAVGEPGLAGPPGEPLAARLAALQIDLDALVDRLGGESALIPEVCAVFVDDSPRLAAQLTEAMAAADLAALAHAAHAVKGAVSNFTDGDLYLQVAAAEQAAREGDHEVAFRHAAALLPGLAGLTAVLAELV